MSWKTIHSDSVIYAYSSFIHWFPHTTLQAMVMTELSESASWVHYCCWKHVCWRYSTVQCLHLYYTNAVLVLVWTGATRSMFHRTHGFLFTYITTHLLWMNCAKKYIKSYYCSNMCTEWLNKICLKSCICNELLAQCCHLPKRLSMENSLLGHITDV